MTHDVLAQAKTRVQQDLKQALSLFDLPSPIKQAVEHAVLLGGKRVRPALVYGAAQLVPSVALDGNAAARRAAVAIELIHCYSLTHDDLPCMDDDQLRRGQPTCHVVFGDATALLAGDLLQSMAFEVLMSPLFESYGADSQEVRLQQSQLLATAASKMVVGQVLDLQAEGQPIDQQQLEYIHLNKTGALIQAAILMGALTVITRQDPAIVPLKQFGHALGLAFQVQDDILDITAATEVLGKTAGKDVVMQKSTYPALLGLNAAQAYANQLHQNALEHLYALSYDTTSLENITSNLLNRVC